MNLKRMEQVVTMCSSSITDLGPINVVDNEILNHQKQVLAANVKDTSEFEPLFLANKYMSERDNHVEVTDIPERMQVCYCACDALEVAGLVLISLFLIPR